MADNVNTIVLKSKGHHDEGVAGSAITPGMAVRLAADGKYDPETLAPGLASRRGIKIAKEDALQGNKITDAYALNDTLFFYTVIAGDHIHCLVKSGEDIDIGDMLAVEGSGSGLFIEAASSATAVYPIPLTSGRFHDDLAVNLPAAAANDDMGLITGTPGTDAPTLQGVDFGGAATDESAGFEVVLPPGYRAGAAITLRALAGMLTTVADEDSVPVTLDAEVWSDDGDGTVSADICATAAQACNSLVMANLDFTITPTGLVAGDVLIINLTWAGDDAGNLGVMIPEIQALELRLGDAVDAPFEALEDTGGALGANGYVRCRAL